MACPRRQATAVALVDLVISTLSVIVIGGIVYAFSDKVAARRTGSEPPVLGRR